MITIKADEHIEIIRQAGRICADTLSLLSSFVEPGKTGLEVDKLAEEYIRSQGGVPTCKGYKGFPYSICYARNSQGVHCFPDNEFIKEGDIIKLDLVVNYKGWNADSALTIIVPPTKNDDLNLVQTTYQALQMGILAAKEGNRVSDISKAIFDAKKDLGVVKEFSGHGIGRNIHEAPQIPNYVVKEKDTLLTSGMIICIEPIFCLGQPDIFLDKNSWPTYTLDGKNLAHFEHTVLITSQKPQILTLRKDENLGLDK